MPHEGDEEKGERCEALLAVDDDAPRSLIDGRVSLLYDATSQFKVRVVGLSNETACFV